MGNSLFQNLYSQETGTISIQNFGICIVTALVLGFLITVVYTYKTRYTKSFAVTLATMPAIVCVVIMMVSGNLGAGIAVAGTFSLVRFRSAQGTAKEIGAIFLAMALGLACGMGYPVLAVLFAIIMSAVNFLYSATRFGEIKHSEVNKTLNITVPEDLDYTGVFDELFAKYTSGHHLIRVKTTNLGSLNRLTYDITLRSPQTEKAFIDDLRCRNGNLEISISIQSDEIYEL